MIDPVKRGIFAALVGRAGGVEVVAAVLEARWGVGNKSAVSKMCNGQIGITLDAAEALEDFVGAFPLTNRAHERKERVDAKQVDLQTLTAQSALATGHAHAALIRAFSHLSDDPSNLTDKERVDVIADARAARQLFTDIIDAAEAAGDD